MRAPGPGEEGAIKQGGEGAREREKRRGRVGVGWVLKPQWTVPSLPLPLRVVLRVVPSSCSNPTHPPLSRRRPLPLSLPPSPPPRSCAVLRPPLPSAAAGVEHRGVHRVGQRRLSALPQRRQRHPQGVRRQPGHGLLARPHPAQGPGHLSPLRQCAQQYEWPEWTRRDGSCGWPVPYHTIGLGGARARARTPLPATLYYGVQLYRSSGETGKNMSDDEIPRKPNGDFELFITAVKPEKLPVRELAHAGARARVRPCAYEPPCRAPSRRPRTRASRC